MTNKTEKPSEGLQIRIPLSLTIKDVITFLVLIVTLALGYGSYQSKIVIMAEQQVALQEINKDHERQIKDLQNELSDQQTTIADLKARLTATEKSLERLWDRRK
jgi:uncharacterized protein YlxW (UPF0749 family)